MPPRRNNGSDGRRERGAAAEVAARRWLEARGLRTLATNFRTRWGELDLVMEHAGQLVFVEVRQRSGTGFGGAAASVTAAKRTRLIRTAAQFLEQRGLGQRPARFDIVAIDGTGIEWLADAFQADE